MANIKEVHKIKDLEQARLLSDPLKLRLLQAFADAPKTAKTVAAELKEPLTKLYRHIDALCDKGLLIVTSETPKRGTVEREFRAVAQRFEADHALFNDEAGDDSMATVRDLLRVTEDEILGVVEGMSDEEEKATFITRIHGKVSQQKYAELQSLLHDWVDTLGKSDNEVEDAVEIGGLIAFYKLAENGN